MKIHLTTLNAKYIHTNRAIRLLKRLADPFYSTQFSEFSIKDSPDHIVQSLLSSGADVIGFSIYIWNVTATLSIISQLKRAQPNLVIIGGGPEVSYDVGAFFETAPFDYIVSGEAEDVWVPLLHAIANQTSVNLEGVATNQIHEVTSLEVQRLDSIPDIVDLYNEDDLAHRIIYIETSRGCPFKCSFCLSSLSQGVRYFPLHEVINQIETFTSKGAKTIKFLDRTMNTHPKRLIAICEHVISQNIPVILQFEIAAEILTAELVDYFTKKVRPGIVRLEIGVQSTNESALKAVDRVQDVMETLILIRTLVEAGRVVVHTDLIAGLPFDDLYAIKKSFNDVFLTFSHELQFGFLKMLRGSKIRNEYRLYGYKYDDNPPYEVISNQFITSEELDRIRTVEKVLEVLWNQPRADHLIRHLYRSGLLNDPFSFFEYLSQVDGFSNRLPLEKLYPWLWKAIEKHFPLDSTYLDDLKLSYITIHPIKPVAWWPLGHKDKPSMLQEMVSWGQGIWSFNQLKKAFITSYYEGYLILTYETEISLQKVTSKSIDTIFRKPL